MKQAQLVYYKREHRTLVRLRTNLYDRLFFMKKYESVENKSDRVKSYIETECNIDRLCELVHEIHVAEKAATVGCLHIEFEE